MFPSLVWRTKKAAPKPELELLKLQLEKTRSAMEAAYSNFENVSDPDLIDCYIYELNAVWKRYKFLLKQAKYLEQHS
jgi:hypothetical protein